MLCLGVSFLRSRWLILTLAVSSLAVFATREAAAQPADEAAATELRIAEQHLDTELATLITDDCGRACLALRSMIAAAEHICELAPGPRCEAAQKKVADARKRVRESCPDCEVAAEARSGLPTEATEETAPATEDQDDAPLAKAPGPPEADHAGGGCAACTLDGRRTDPPLGWLLLGLTAAAARRRRRRT
jgi:MYXO-CTERM domain-containing protein